MIYTFLTITNVCGFGKGEGENRTKTIPDDPRIEIEDINIWNEDEEAEFYYFKYTK